MARNVQALQLEPGKFNYRLVWAEIAFEDYGTIVAHARSGAVEHTSFPTRSCHLAE
ncbi:MAG: hypothetical protein R2706_17870 [Acidimicrobiales bacterium]